jgi:hypothetical protein
MLTKDNPLAVYGSSTDSKPAGGAKFRASPHIRDAV